ncbi:hypothetical protein [Marinobacter sp. S6332]|uniref:hypothetical protein n=1 Tax=Marinobacter sp. S6332 TaxID=2926403 RepID=UPI001FF4172B|nr:hypothetical protein [Marinobacter sp. S6332]MCK0163785.1 hypothetical protein [Marinobacter sp. S6332]
MSLNRWPPIHVVSEPSKTDWLTLSVGLPLIVSHGTLGIGVSNIAGKRHGRAGTIACAGRCTGPNMPECKSRIRVSLIEISQAVGTGLQSQVGVVSDLLEYQEDE